MTDFERLMKYFSGTSYGDLIVSFFELIGIIIGLFYARKQRVGVCFLLYLVFDFTISICDSYIATFSGFSKRAIELFMGQTNTIIALTELFAYFYFFSKILHNKKIIALMKIFALLFALIVLVFFSTKYSFLSKRFFYVSNLVGTIEFLFLIPLCLMYYYELFQNNPAINLHQRPSFWIVTGIFFFSVISIPYNMLDRFLMDNNSVYWSFTYLLFFSIPFSINMIFLSKAFLCRKSLTT